MTTYSPTSAHRPDAPTANSAFDVQRGRVPARRSDETKAAFKTTEFIVYVVAVIGVLIASFLVQHRLTRMRTTSEPTGHGSTL